MPTEPRPSSRAAGLVGEAVLCVLLGAVVGVLAAFESLWTVHRVWAGVGIATLATAALSLGLAQGLRSSAAPLSASGGWVLAVLYFASGRPEGDVIVPGSGQGYAFLLLGALALAVGIGQGTRLQRRYTSGPEEPKTSV